MKRDFDVQQILDNVPVADQGPLFRRALARIEERLGEPGNVRGSAESLEIDSDEGGWHLLATTSDGDDIDLRIHGVAFEFAQSKGMLSLVEWALEGARVKIEHGRSLDDDLEDDTGYDVNDPKHPRYRERMADAADDARKRDRESV